ncbi:MAG: hypothetical protein ACOX6T_15855 [Myxococcales bacterium]
MRLLRSSLIVALVVLLAGRAGASDGGAQATAAAAGDDGRGWQVDVDAREEYRFRASAAPGESDQDLHLALDLRAADLTGRLGADAALGLWWDLDGNPWGEAFGLASVYDGRNPWIDVYQLSAEYRSLGLLRTARAGRQVAEHGRPATFDGAYVNLRGRHLGFFAFGGRTEHFFETGDESLFEDWIAAVGASARPISSLRIEVDYRYIREAIENLDAERDAVEDHSYGVTAWYRGGDWLRAKAFARGLSRQFSEAGGQVRLYWSAQDAGLDARFFAQPVSMRDINELDNPFFLTLGRSLPHTRWRADLWKGHSGQSLRWEAHLGYEGRRLLHDEESAFNRNTAHMYLLAAVSDIEALPGLSASVSLERVGADASPFSGEGEWAVGGGLRYELGALRAEVGSQYHRYRYLYYRDLEELADVRAFYGDLQYKATEWLAVRGRYSAEVFDRTLHTFVVSLAQGY